VSDPLIIATMPAAVTAIGGVAIALVTTRNRSRRAVQRRPPSDAELDVERSWRRALHTGWRRYYQRVKRGGSSDLTPTEKQLLYPKEEAP
jgi:hypothetical protein